jgi:hypothetical protein
MYLKIYLDERFQRPIAWNKTNRDGFISSIMREKGNVNFCIASVKECMEYCLEKGLTLDAEYFRIISVDYKWVSIDGNNRLVVLHNFINGVKDEDGNELEIDFGSEPYEINIYDEDKNSETYGEVIKSFSKILGKSTYENLPLDFKEYFDERCMYVEDLQGSTRYDCQEKFININSNVTLTPMELRTAIICHFSDYIREFSLNYRWIENQVSKISVKGRNLDEFVLACFVYLGSDKISSIGKTEYDLPYKDESCSTYLRKITSKITLKKALKTFKRFVDLGIAEITNKHELFNWVMVYDYWTKSGVHFDVNELYKNFKGAHNSLMKSDKHIFRDKGNPYTYSGCNSAFNVGKMIARLTALNELIMKNEKLFTFDEVEKKVDETYTGERDIKRFYTAKDRYELWLKQGGSHTMLNEETGKLVEGTDAICPVSKKTIPYMEIQNGRLWEADHIKPWSKGGRTTIENGQLIKKAYNRVKSNSMPEEEEFDTFALAA